MAKYRNLFFGEISPSIRLPPVRGVRDEPASVAAALPACSDVERGECAARRFGGITGVPTYVLWWCQCLVRSGGRSLLPVRGRASAHM